MRPNFYKVTTINIETKLLDRLKKMAQKDFNAGRAPNKSVSSLINELLKQAISRKAGK